MTWVLKNIRELRLEFVIEMAKRPKDRNIFSTFSIILHLAFELTPWLVSAWLVGLSDGAANCTDGYDDVFSLALDHWAGGGNKIETQVSFPVSISVTFESRTYDSIRGNLVHP